MIWQMFAIFDSASQVHERPFVARTEGEAVRMFADIANDKSHVIGQHPEHFSLCWIGEYDDNLGIPQAGDRRVVTNGQLSQRVIREDEEVILNGGESEEFPTIDGDNVNG